MEQHSSAAQGGSRELQGPRPAPLKVSKDSHKIRKPQQQQPVQQVRQPVIIYTMSPKVVHANPADFMSVVQRLTGAPRAVSTAQQPPATLPLEQSWSSGAGDHGSVGVLPPLPTSILSPVPGSLPAIPASFFSPPPADAALQGELISPAAAAAAAAFVGAPSPSPTAGAYYWDLFNNINMQQQYHHPY